ncbi:MAG: cobalamin biosynthesis protein CbiG [Firmicutes bacterium]|nr:cobalamin biosynthesis protein CbiG [Bacillota bacterium]
MKVSIIAFTAKGFALAARLQALLGAAGRAAEHYRCRDGGLQEWTRRHFAAADALLFIGAAGIAVRAVAPHLQSKTTDPAVVVLDEQGKFVIPLLAGHIGGANRLAQEVAALLTAVPVMTTATECSGVFAFDSWASKNKIKILNPGRIKSVAARMLAGENIYLRSMFPVAGALPAGVVPAFEHCDVLISVKTGAGKEVLQLIPPVLTLGVGCRKGVTAGALQKAWVKLLQKAGCHQEAVGLVCSIDLKAQEAGLLSFCAACGLPLQTFAAEQLRAVPGDFTASAFVQKVAGVDNVCERSAVLGSGGKLIWRKSIENGVALALAVAPYTLCFEEEQ